MLHQRIPPNYKPKKAPHMVYYDIENIHLDGADTLRRMRMHEINLASHHRYLNIIDQFTEQCVSEHVLKHMVMFDNPEKDRADELLLKALERDSKRYKSIPNMTFVLFTRDKSLQEKFSKLAIDNNAYFKIISPKHKQALAA